MLRELVFEARHTGDFPRENRKSPGRISLQAARESFPLIPVFDIQEGYGMPPADGKGEFGRQCLTN